jgi:hypothetical protein
MTVITPTVHGERLVRESRKFFTASAWLSELAQNSYRAHATSLSIVCEGNDVIYSDNGTGLQTEQDWLHFLSLGSTGWNASTVANQTPAGIGALSLLLNHEVEVYSGPFCLHSTPEALIETLAYEQPLELQDCSTPTPGFRVRIKNGLKLLLAKVGSHQLIEAAIGPMLLTMDGDPMQVFIKLAPHDDWAYSLLSYVNEPYKGPVSHFCGCYRSFLEHSNELAFPGFSFETMWVNAPITNGTLIPSFHSDTLSIIPSPGFYTPATHINFHGKILKGPSVSLQHELLPALTWRIYIHGETAQPFDLVLPERNAVIENEKWHEFVAQHVKPLFDSYLASIQAFSAGSVQPAILSTEGDWVLSLAQILGEGEGFSNPYGALPQDTERHPNHWLTKVPDAYNDVAFFTSLPPYTEYGSHNSGDIWFPSNYYEDVLPDEGLRDLMAAMKALPGAGVTVGNFLLHDHVPADLQDKFHPLNDFELDYTPYDDDAEATFILPVAFGGYNLFLCKDPSLRCKATGQSWNLSQIPWVFFGNNYYSGEGSHLYATQPFLDAIAAKCPTACRQLYDIIITGFNPNEDSMDTETDQAHDFLEDRDSILQYSEPLPQLADMAADMVKTLLDSTCPEVSLTLRRADATLLIKQLKLSQTQHFAQLSIIVEAPDMVYRGTWEDVTGWAWKNTPRKRTPKTT